MDGNTMYKLAWYFTYATHFIVFTPMAFLWPFTYLGSPLIVEFYNLANYYLGTVVATGVYSLNIFMWILAVIFYDETTTMTRRSVWQEMLLYIMIEGFSWYTSVYEYPLAHD